MIVAEKAVNTSIAPEAKRETDIVVIGAGVIGLAIAWKVSASQRVTLVDPAPGSGASDVAAGMLAPVTELTYGEEALSRLTLASAARYPSFVEELSAASGVVVGYRQTGTLTAALDSDDEAVLDEMFAFIRRHDLRVERLTGHAARRREPLLDPHLHAALWVPDDHQVDPRLLVTALRRACERNGVRHVAARADCVLTAGGRVAGVRLDGGGELAAATVVIAAGVESARLTEGIEALPLRPVKGQLLVLRTQDGMPLLQQTVRGLAHGFAVYLVPRTDGRVIVGATVEERGHDTTVTADAMYTLLRDARRLVPGITELELLEFRAGLRPGTPDNAPVIGPGAVPGMVWATGHYRNGILLTPVTADAVVALLRYGELPEVAAPFLSARFARSRGKVIS